MGKDCVKREDVQFFQEEVVFDGRTAPSLLC